LDRGIRGLVALGEEGNECGNVLFELGEVQEYVVLIELHVFMILHGGSDGQLELRVLEVADHLLHVILNFDHLVLNLSDLSILGLRGLLNIANFLSQFLFKSAFLFLGELAKLLVPLNFSFNILIKLANYVDLTVQIVDVVDQ